MGRKRKAVGGGAVGDEGDDDEAAQPLLPDAGLAAMIANPALLAANPLLAISMMSNPALLASATASLAGGGTAQGKLPLPSLMVDPDVQELCDHFHIEERHAKRLSEIMRNRQDTFVEDLERLYDVLERANSPAGLLVVKMREMDDGTFVGKAKADKELAAISKRHKLDDQAESKLADILARYDEARRKEYLVEIERHLEVSNRPSAMAMMLLRKLGEGKPLGKPGPAVPGSYLDKQQRESKGGSGGSGRDRDGDQGGSCKGDRDRDRRSRSRRR